MAITRRLPAPLSERLASASAALFSRQGREFDVAIGGIPFMLATTTDIPQTIETIKVRKDQFDIEDPGEQSLTGWWRRSQASFHLGAGNTYAESSTENADIPGFHDSSGIDVFTQGQLRLLKKMKQAGVTGTKHSRVRGFAVSSVRTNLCANPSLEVNTTGWTPASGGGGDTAPTFTRVDPVAEGIDAAPSGSYVGKLVWGNDDAAGFPPSLQIAASTTLPNTTCTSQVRVYIPSGNIGVSLLGNGVFGDNTGLVKDQWITLTLTRTPGSGGTVQTFLWPMTPVTAGQVFYIDSCVIEEGSYIGPYFDGDFVDSEWTGTPHASTSVQTLDSTSVSFSAVVDGALHTAVDKTGTFTSLHAPAAKTVVDGLVSGSTFYDITDDGTLYMGDTSAPASATSWPLGTAIPKRVAWGKHRLWVISDRKLWQPNLADAAGTAQDPIYIHPNPGWKYTCMAEGPAAMYFGGHDGLTSSIQAITLDAGGGLPTLSGATITAVLPDGELVQELAVAAGQYVGIGTSRGFRVGLVGSDGAITYGPLLVEPEGVVRCTSVMSQGRFFVVGFQTEEGNAETYRIDTGTQITDGVFPYARDIDCHFTGYVNSLASDGGSVVCTASDGKVYYQSDTEYVDTGWLETGRVRFRTTEPKQFRYVDLDIEPLEGNIQVTLVKEGGSEFPLGNLTEQGHTADDSFFYDRDPLRYVSLKLTLTPTADGLNSPTVNSYLIRALPSVAPQRLITLPLLCFDYEQARSGQRYGGKDYAKDRLTALLTLEDDATVIVYQDFGDLLEARQVVIDGLRFVQTATAADSSGTGGILIAELRTVDL